MRTRDELERMEFYAQDVRALQALGFEVRTAVRVHELRPADLYVAWWWTWACFPVAFAHVMRRPVIVTGVFDHWKYPSRPLAHRLLHRFALRAASANVFVSGLEYGQVPGVLPVRNPWYAPHAIDEAIYRPGHGPRGAFVLTMATMSGGNGWRKCIEEIVRAVPLVRQSMPDVRFVIAGEPDVRYSRLASALQVDDVIEFPGVIDRQRKVELMQRCAVYLQPSRFEGFGLAIAEAMACGAPVVTSDAGAVREVVGDAAEFVDGTSVPSIARGVTQLLLDPHRREALSREGSERIARHFSFARHKRDWAQIVDSVL